MEELDGPVTVLFTDFEGSTDLHTRVGDEEARKLLDGYEQTIRGELDAHRGRAVKNLGDGLLVEFSSARRAVACAVAVQQAVTDHAAHQRDGERVRLRIGINTGEVIHRDGDVFGSAVNAAARIMALAEGGQILVSDVTRQLAEQGGGLTFREFGQVTLRGLGGDWLLHEAVWRADDASGTRTPRATTTLLGRDTALAVVAPSVEDATRGRGQVVLIAGEAGIGKTALAEELVERAVRRGAAVHWATCWDGEGAPAYWPWVQVLRSIIDTEGQTILHQLGPVADELGRLLPELTSDASQRGGGDADEARFRLFDGVGSLLTRAAARQPHVVVLDDLHWADPPSLHLLGFLARQLRAARVLVVGTYRDVEVAASEVLSPLIGDLARSSVAITLGGLGAEDVSGLIASLSGTAPDPELAASIHRRTGGNPFFVREVTRLMASGGVAAGAIPDGVREVVERRLVRLPQACADMLATAAVIGQDVSLDVLAAATARSVTELLDLLDQAVRARVLAEAPSPLGPYRFAHDLFRETLYNGLTTGARLAAHERVATALEEARSSGGSVPAAEIARHWMAALPAGNPARAATWSARAAEQAMEQLAFSEAGAHYERALQAAEVNSGATDHDKLELQLALSDALTKAGEGDRARTVLTDVVELARRTQSQRALVTAALGLDRLGTRTGVPDPEGEALLEEALGGVPDDPRLRSLVLGALARRRYHTRTEQGGGEALIRAEEAVAEARRSGDAAVLAAALGALHDAYWLPGQPQARLEVATEMETVAASAGDADLVMQAALLRYTALLELGSAEAVPQFERFVAAGAACRHRRATYYSLTRQATYATMRGHFEEARALLAESLALGEAIGEPDVYRVYLSQTSSLADAEGRHVSTDDALDDTYRMAFRDSAAVADALAMLDDGDVEGARAVLAPYAERDPDTLIADYSWLYTVAGLVEGLQRAGFTEAAARAAAVLSRYRGTCIVVAAAVGFEGAVDHHLGKYEMATGNVREARASLEAAVAIHERVGAAGWAHQSRQALAALDRAEPSAVFRRNGDVWTLTYEGVTTHAKDAKGMRDLAVLLASPNVDVHVTELLGAAERGGADAVLDARARDEYRERLSDLEADIAEADAAHDDERAARAKAERDVLVDELTAAMGIGGRARTLGDPVERARKAVSARIREAMTRIASQHPALGAHLDASVATGTFCSYRPRQPITWEL